MQFETTLLEIFERPRTPFTTARKNLGLRTQYSDRLLRHSPHNPPLLVLFSIKSKMKIMKLIKKMALLA